MNLTYDLWWQGLSNNERQLLYKTAGYTDATWSALSQATREAYILKWLQNSQRNVTPDQIGFASVANVLSIANGDPTVAVQTSALPVSVLLGDDMTGKTEASRNGPINGALVAGGAVLGILLLLVLVK